MNDLLDDLEALDEIFSVLEVHELRGEVNKQLLDPRGCIGSAPRRRLELLNCIVASRRACDALAESDLLIGREGVQFGDGLVRVVAGRDVVETGLICLICGRGRH